MGLFSYFKINHSLSIVVREYRQLHYVLICEFGIFKNVLHNADICAIPSLAWLDPARECNCDGRVRKRGGEKGLAHFIFQLRNLTNQILLVGMRIVEFQVPVAEVYVNRLYSKHLTFWLPGCRLPMKCARPFSPPLFLTRPSQLHSHAGREGSSHARLCHP